MTLGEFLLVLAASFFVFLGGAIVGTLSERRRWEDITVQRGIAEHIQTPTGQKWQWKEGK